ncbi:uncharacterized protein AB675_4397 [Cyphellophora attinorum]|uniref:Uncharacterized protein n=1 Tax=Cyphellophora attinorum TaxID=1664694 RepID=A0A0N1NWH7_9EURO|nr:uncharacterized protein AB675_4397 [Phialophora attinorum]KPI36565.1 hypothetical protein AB675_4397 [Phialophora attinorum]
MLWMFDGKTMIDTKRRRFVRKSSKSATETPRRPFHSHDGVDRSVRLPYCNTTGQACLPAPNCDREVMVSPRRPRRETLEQSLRHVEISGSGTGAVVIRNHAEPPLRQELSTALGSVNETQTTSIPYRPSAPLSSVQSDRDRAIALRHALDVKLGAANPSMLYATSNQGPEQIRPQSTLVDRGNEKYIVLDQSTPSRPQVHGEPDQLPLPELYCAEFWNDPNGHIDVLLPAPPTSLTEAFRLETEQLLMIEEFNEVLRAHGRPLYRGRWYGWI